MAPQQILIGPCRFFFGLVQARCHLLSVINDQFAVCGQVVQQRSRPAEQIREIPFDSTESAAGVQVFQLLGNFLPDGKEQVGFS